MRKLFWLGLIVGCLALIEAGKVTPRIHAQEAPKSGQKEIQPFIGGQGDLPALMSLDDMLPRWRLLPTEKAYASIDGKHLVQYVNDLTAIAYRYRDSGHPFWGRFIGFPPHVEAEHWVADKFKTIGLDVRNVTLDLPPQWNAKSWEVTATGHGKTLSLGTAYPAQKSAGTSASGVNLETVYAGMGAEADYHGMDVHGKAVVILSIPLPAVISGSAGASFDNSLQRAIDKGAAAVIEVVLLPGNVRGQIAGGQGFKVPTFSMGMEDGYALRDLIAQAPQNDPVHLKVRLDVEEVPNLKTDIVFGTLPGMTDEKIYVFAHLDSWFQGATDNGSGVATMLGLAEYFSKVPKEQRRRTMIFMGSPGHHNGRTWAGEYLKEHKEMLAKTALVINSEHTSAQGTHIYGWALEKTNAADPNNWYVGGSDKFKDIALKAAVEFGVLMYHRPMSTAPGEMSPVYQLVPASIQNMNTNPAYFHSDHDDIVSYTQLEAVTRSYAKLIVETDKMSIKELEAPASKQITQASGAR